MTITTNNTSWATTTGIIMAYPPYSFIGQEKKSKERNEMTLYKVYVVDLLHGKVMSEHTRIGRDEGDAGVGMELTEAEKKLRDKDALEIIWQDVGEFQKIVRTRTIVEEDEE